MKRLENGDIEVNGKVWSAADKPSHWVRDCWYLSAGDRLWYLYFEYQCVAQGYTPEECLTEVKIVAERVGEL